MAETNECLVCKAPLEYLNVEEQMECCMCHKTKGSKTRCVNGHFVCDECHARGLDQIFPACLGHESKDPLKILDDLMALPFCHANGNEHHVLVAASLLTAYKNAGGDIDLEQALGECLVRGTKVPGGICGFWGACGAAISSGQFVSIATGSTPLAERPWALSNRMTSMSLASISNIDGPRCCKRCSKLAVIEGIRFARENLGVEMESSHDLTCRTMAQNKQCIGKRCPFFPQN